VFRRRPHFDDHNHGWSLHSLGFGAKTRQRIGSFLLFGSAGLTLRSRKQGTLRAKLALRDQDPCEAKLLLTINEEEEKPLLVLVPPHQYTVRSTYKVDGKTLHQDQYRLSKQTKTKRARLYTPCSKTSVANVSWFAQESCLPLETPDRLGFYPQCGSRNFQIVCAALKSPNATLFI
jgi:hypothetical protein